MQQALNIYILGNQPDFARKQTYFSCLLCAVHVKWQVSKIVVSSLSFSLLPYKQHSCYQNINVKTFIS